MGAVCFWDGAPDTIRNNSRATVGIWLASCGRLRRQKFTRSTIWAARRKESGPWPIRSIMSGRKRLRDKPAIASAGVISEAPVVSAVGSWERMKMFETTRCSNPARAEMGRAGVEPGGMNAAISDATGRGAAMLGAVRTRSPSSQSMQGSSAISGAPKQLMQVASEVFPLLAGPTKRAAPRGVATALACSAIILRT